MNDEERRQIPLVCAGSPLLVTFVSILTKQDFSLLALLLFVEIALHWIFSVFVEYCWTRDKLDRLFRATFFFDLANIALSFYLIETILHTPQVGTESVDRVGAALVTPYILFLTLKLTRQLEIYQNSK